MKGCDFMTFGQKIKIRRKQLGYTQAELAERVHTTQPYISRLENDNLNLSMKMITKVLSALNINVEYLFSDDRKEVNV
ncbi:MAG: helix-turn-helix domain-containing protein [Oscillospiraceae bacterium]|nr:helix-turn-helix domain-containing protein [Oscillospiraceae bacterium]